MIADDRAHCESGIQFEGKIKKRFLSVAVWIIRTQYLGRIEEYAGTLDHVQVRFHR